MTYFIIQCILISNTFEGEYHITLIGYARVSSSDQNEARQIEEFKKLVKNGLSEDVEKDAEEEMQKMTDKAIKEVDEIFAKKEKEIMEV